ncbi:Uncharacterised protein [Flavonifractor plautii]|nr:Uncharacterised protein [Flavonifractor plautii]
MQQVEHKGAVQRGFGLLPKRVVVGGVLWRGVLNEVVDQPEHVRVLSDVAEWVVAVRMGGVYQIEYPQDIAALEQQRPHRPHDFALGISTDIRGVCQHDVGLYQKAGLACAAAADDDLQQVAAVLLAVQAHLQVLGQNHVPVRVLAVAILPVQRPHVAPRRRAVLHAGAAVLPGGVVQGDCGGIERQRPQQETGRVRRPADGKRMVQLGGKPLHEVKDSHAGRIGIRRHGGKVKDGDGQRGPYRPCVFEALLLQRRAPLPLRRRRAPVCFLHGRLRPQGLVDGFPVLAALGFRGPALCDRCGVQVAD